LEQIEGVGGNSASGDVDGKKRMGEDQVEVAKGLYMGNAMGGKEIQEGKGRGGMIMGVRKELIERGEIIQTEKRGIIVGNAKRDGQRWRIIGVYARQGVGEILQGVENWMEERESGWSIIMGGDFNARTGEMGAGIELESGENGREEEREKRKRKSKDKNMNKEGRILVDFLEERGWGILNGSIRGDEQGEYTFTGGAGNTVIDYVMGEEEVRDRVRSLRVEDKIDSDHHPVVIHMKGKEREGGRKGGKNKRIRRGIWNEEGREAYRKRIERLEREEGGVENGRRIGKENKKGDRGHRGKDRGGR